jgi:2-iminobutanoate/2-iminopropanoate deaminase
MNQRSEYEVFFLCCVLVATAACNRQPKAVYTPDAPNPVGPYSQAQVAGGFVFGAGQLGIDPKQGKIVASTAEGQMEQAIKNMFAVLSASGSEPQKLVKVNVYFKSLDDFEKVNAVYTRMLGATKPARSAVQVDRIPLDALIEIDYIAAR